MAIGLFFHIVMNVLMREQSERDCKSPPDKIVLDTFSRSTKNKKVVAILLSSQSKKDRTVT